MMQWVNRLWNNIFINPPTLLLLSEISGALHLAQLGLMAGRQAGWLAGRQNSGGFKNFRICYRSTYSTFCFV